MVVRKSRKSRKKRGSRTVGGGSGRKRRHSGHKGGRGYAGSHKHRWVQVRSKDPYHFGKRGFTRPPKLQKSPRTINVGELDEYAEELVERGLAEEEGGEIIINASELSCDKILGSGRVSRPLKVFADEFSVSARREIEEAGGEAVSGES